MLGWTDRILSTSLVSPGEDFRDICSKNAGSARHCCRTVMKKFNLSVHGRVFIKAIISGVSCSYRCLLRASAFWYVTPGLWWIVKWYACFMVEAKSDITEFLTLKQDILSQIHPILIRLLSVIFHHGRWHVLWCRFWLRTNPIAIAGASVETINSLKVREEQELVMVSVLLTRCQTLTYIHLSVWIFWPYEVVDLKDIQFLNNPE